MFQKFSLYRIVSGLPDSVAVVSDNLYRGKFAPTLSTQEKSCGFVPPRGENYGEYVESVSGQWVARFIVETRSVPSDAVQRLIDEDAAEIEKLFGRTPSRQKRKQIKEYAVIRLLPQAFPKRTAIPIWFDRVSGLLVVGATSASHIDDVITALCGLVPGLVLNTVTTEIPPVGAMSAWLSSFRFGDCASEAFEVGQECELRATDDSNAVIRYKNLDLSRDEILEHIQQGKTPASVVLTWCDRVSFVLTKSLQFKKVELLDVVLEGKTSDGEDHFDADVTIATGELHPMIAEMIAEMGGMMEPCAVADLPGDALQDDTGPVVESADPLIDRARAVVISHNKASISLLNMTLGVGYHRCARLLEDLEREGTVSPMQFDGSRKILKTEGLGK